MSKHEQCQHCLTEIFWSNDRCAWLHWRTCEPSCGLSAQPNRYKP